MHLYNATADCAAASWTTMVVEFATDDKMANGKTREAVAAPPCCALYERRSHINAQKTLPEDRQERSGETQRVC